MLDNLGAIDPTKFIRHYWNSKYSFTRKKDLYKQIRIHIVSPNDVVEILKDLVKQSELYAALESPSSNKFFEDGLLNDRLIEMNYLGASSYYPIVLAVDRMNFNENDINNILKALETLIVRNFVVGGKVANKYEREFSNIAKKISDGNLYKASEIIDTIKDLTLNDDEFIDDFRIFTTKQADKIRYLLRKLNNHSNVETRIINDNKSVHIEHILPKKPRDNEWVDFDVDAHEEYLWRLGNLTLLGQEYNRNATNKEFDDKKEIYLKSDIAMTRKLADFESWRKSDINNRQQSFSELAPSIWEK